MAASATTLVPFSTLTIAAGVNAYDADGNFANVSSGAWFAFDFNRNGNISGTPRRTHSAREHRSRY